MVHTRVSGNLPTLEALPRIERPSRVLLTTPTHFQVEYTINPHMEGNIGDVDESRAQRQWRELRSTYDSLGIDVHVVEGQEGLPDMVFCANQSLPILTPDGKRKVVLSRMHAPQRKPEVPYYGEFFDNRNYEIHELDPDLPGDFEGMGDAIWHPGRFMLWGGHGFRTDIEVYQRWSKRLDLIVIALSLEDPIFYHLDTCFCPIDEDTVLIYPGAFDEASLELIHHYFERVIEAPEDESRNLLACNAHSPDGRHVIIQRGCTETRKALEAHGYTVLEVDTDEFLKAGGSVFCMKLMFW